MVGLRLEVRGNRIWLSPIRSSKVLGLYFFLHFLPWLILGSRYYSVHFALAGSVQASSWSTAFVSLNCRSLQVSELLISQLDKCQIGSRSTWTHSRLEPSPSPTIRPKLDSLQESNRGWQGLTVRPQRCFAPALEPLLLLPCIQTYGSRFRLCTLDENQCKGAREPPSCRVDWRFGEMCLHH
jgi:hypothetical protein